MPHRVGGSSAQHGAECNYTARRSEGQTHGVHGPQAELSSAMMQYRGASADGITQSCKEVQRTNVVHSGIHQAGAQCCATGMWKNPKGVSSSLASSSPSPDTSTGPGAYLVLQEFSQKDISSLGMYNGTEIQGREGCDVVRKELLGVETQFRMQAQYNPKEESRYRLKGDRK